MHSKRDEIVRLYLTGEHTYQSLAALYEVHVNTIWVYLKMWLTAEQRETVAKLQYDRLHLEQARLKPFEEEIVSRYLATDKSAAQIAREYATSKRAIATIIERNTTPEQRAAVRDCRQTRGAKNANFRGGIKHNGAGYRQRMTNGRYILEHRLVAQAALGRELADEEIVHHMDGNPRNNHPDNLVVLPSRKRHVQLHYFIYRRFAELHPRLNKKLHQEFLEEMARIEAPKQKSLV